MGHSSFNHTTCGAVALPGWQQHLLLLGCCQVHFKTLI
jgi:hypothetical protein